MTHCIRSGAILLGTILLCAASAVADGPQRAPEPQWLHGDKVTSSLELSFSSDPLARLTPLFRHKVTSAHMRYERYYRPRYEDTYIPFAYIPYDYRFGRLAVAFTFRHVQDFSVDFF